MICELHCVECDAILISETWRQTQEIWETQHGHIMVESGQFINKHGGCDTVEQEMEESDQLGGRCESERVVAMSNLGQQTTDSADECVHATRWIR